MSSVSLSSNVVNGSGIPIWLIWPFWLIGSLALLVFDMIIFQLGMGPTSFPHLLGVRLRAFSICFFVVKRSFSLGLQCGRPVWLVCDNLSRNVGFGLYASFGNDLWIDNIPCVLGTKCILVSLTLKIGRLDMSESLLMEISLEIYSWRDPFSY